MELVALEKWVSVRHGPPDGPASTPEQTEPPPAFEAPAGLPHPTLSDVPCHPHQPVRLCQYRTPGPSGLSYEW